MLFKKKEIKTKNQDAQQEAKHPSDNNNNSSFDKNNLIKCVEAAINGDYEVLPNGNDELSLKIKQLIEHIAEIQSKELDFAVSVSMQNSETSITAANILSAAKDINHKSQSIAAATDEMVATVQQISETSTDVANSSQQVRQIVLEGADSTRKAIGQMTAIADSVESTAAQTTELNKASEEIGTIVEDIQKIADQTNLLALNATIEAARAGEAGKGFAVVANEVKSLSRQTAEATENIRDRISSLQAEMNAIVASMEQGVSAVNVGKETMGVLGEQMSAVESKIVEMADRMSEISSILEQQTEASNEIAGSIGKITQSTHSNIEKVLELANNIDVSQSIIDKSLAELANLNIAKKVIRLAKADHVIWKKKIADMSVGRIALKDDELADHHSCRLGKWYFSDASAEFKDNELFKKLDTPHEKVHKHGKLAAAYFNDGKLNEALEEMQKMETASQEVIAILEELAKE